MPGASSPWLDSWAPPQWVSGATGASGPARSPDPGAATVNGTTNNYDSILHYKVAGTIILALVVVFGLQALGFRFVVAAGVGS